MLFYFIAHFCIGLLAGNFANLFFKAKQAPFLFPLWFNGPIFLVINSIALLVFFTAPILTGIDWGFGWTLITIFELILGVFIAGVLPINYRVFLTLTGPFLILAFAGALLNLWYLNNIAILVLLVLGFGLPFLLLNNQNNGNAGVANSTQPTNSNVSKNTSQSKVQNAPMQTNKQNALPTFLTDLDIAKLPKTGKKASLDLVEKTKHILSAEFNYEVENQAEYILSSACYQAQKFNGNEYDAAVKFIMFRLASLSGLQSSRKTSFIETQTQNLVRLENQCNICRGFIRICLNPIRDKHNLSKL